MGTDPQPLQLDASDMWGNVMVDIEEYDLQALTAMRERRGLAPLPLEQRLNEVVLKRLESRTTPTQNTSSILASSSGDVQHHRSSSTTNNNEDGPLLPVKQQLFQPLPLQLPPISDELEGTATAPMRIATSTSSAPITGGGGGGSHVPVPTMSNMQTNTNTNTNTNTRPSQSQSQHKRFASSRGSSFLSRDRGRGSIQVYRGNL
jgi:hypothetical protein